MTTTLAVTEAIDSIRKAESIFNLRCIDDSQFFPEWFEHMLLLFPTVGNSNILDSTPNVFREVHSIKAIGGSAC